MHNRWALGRPAEGGVAGERAELGCAAGRRRGHAQCGAPAGVPARAALERHARFSGLHSNPEAGCWHRSRFKGGLLRLLLWGSLMDGLMWWASVNRVDLADHMRNLFCLTSLSKQCRLAVHVLHASSSQRPLTQVVKCCVPPLVFCPEKSPWQLTPGLLMQEAVALQTGPVCYPHQYHTS